MSLLLSNVGEENYFSVKDGRILKNVEDLRNVLKDIEDKHFAKHVKGDKNEFANWVQKYVQDEGLAKGLYRVGDNKVKALKVVDSWLNYVVKEHKLKLNNKPVAKQDLIKKKLYERRMIADKERKVVKASSVKSILRVLKNG